MMRPFFIIGVAFLLSGCSAKVVLKANKTGKFWDEYFVLKKKRYKYYTKLIVNLPHDYGRYVISHDTIYLLTKKGKFYYMSGYGILNIPASSLVVEGLDTTGSKQFNIYYYRR